MAYNEESEGSEDSDYEELSVPAFPPEKPPNAVMFYVENNRNRGVSDDQLRREFNELLGKQDRQKWKTKHKRAKRKYQKLLQLYSDANPGFNAEEHNAYSGGANRSRKHKASGGGKRRRNPNNNNNAYGSRAAYVGINTFDDEYDNNPQPATKRRRRAGADNHNNNASGGSIDELFKDINSGSKRVVRDPEKFKLQPEHKEAMEKLVNSMRDAAKKDWECNRAKKPAINTSKLLDVVVSELSKKLFYRFYLDDTDILEAIRDWIHPLPDGSLPALKIRTEMYRIINKFALHEYDQNSLDHYLQISEDKAKDPSYKIDEHPNLKSFSKTCMNLWAHKKETNSNKVLLRKMIEKWIRTLVGSDSNYDHLADEMRENKQQIQERYKILQKQKRDFNFGKQKRAKIPEKAWHDFAITPADIIHEDMNNGANRGLFGNRSHPLQDRMNKTFRKTTTTKQASKPSITGRRIRK